MPSWGLNFDRLCPNRALQPLGYRIRLHMSDYQMIGQISVPHMEDQWL